MQAADPSGLEPELHITRRYRRCFMICPLCRSQKEMLFSVLSLAFICSEAHCGFELEVEVRDAEALLKPEQDLIFA